MNLAEMQQELSELRTKATDALAEIRSNTDDSRATELENRHDAIMADYDKLTAKIDREQRHAKLVGDADQRLEDRARSERESRRPGGNGEARGIDEEKPLAYRNVFHKMLQMGGEVADLSSEERAVLRSGFDAEVRAQTSGTTTAGGYTVPTEIANFISEAMKLAGPMWDENLCTFLDTVSGNPIKVPTLDDTSGTAYAHTEAAALTDDSSADATFGQASLDAYVYDTKFIRWSLELSQDSIFAVESLLGRLLGVRMGRLANNKLTVGTGSSQPNGIVTASALGKTSASAAAIIFDEVIDLFHSVDPMYRGSPKARFMMNDSTLQAVRKLKDGQGNYLWQEGHVTAGLPATILSKPYSINQDMASQATGNKVMLFGDFSYFYIRRVGAPVVGVMRERFWPDLGIAGYLRFDSEIGQSGAIKHLKNA